MTDYLLDITLSSVLFISRRYIATADGLSQAVHSYIRAAVKICAAKRQLSSC